MNKVHTPQNFGLQIYAAGGFAMNVVSKFEQSLTPDIAEKLAIRYIDTSTANLVGHVDQANVYIYKKPGSAGGSEPSSQMGGGGKDRRSTYAAIAPHIPEIMKKYPPKNFNIVVHSCSGASGATVGPAIVGELLDRGVPVMVIQVGSQGSRKELENTLGTLQSYVNLSASKKKPIVAYYRENNPHTTFGEVDADVTSALFMSTLLFSDENPGMDKADLINLLNYPAVTTFKPELSGLEFFRDTVDVPDHVVPQAQAMLLGSLNGDEISGTMSNIKVEYTADAKLGEKNQNRVPGVSSVFALVYTGDYVTIVSRLTRELELYKEEERTRSSAMSLTADEIPAGEDFMSF